MMRERAGHVGAADHHDRAQQLKQRSPLIISLFDLLSRPPPCSCSVQSPSLRVSDAGFPAEKHPAARNGRDAFLDWSDDDERRQE